MHDDSGDIEIPVVYISGDWAVDDIDTLEDCEDAYIKLMQICAGIEARIEDLTASGHSVGSAKAALRWKKLALNLVNLKKSKITRKRNEAKLLERDSLKLAFIATEDPDMMQRASEWAQAAMIRRMADFECPPQPDLQTTPTPD